MNPELVMRRLIVAMWATALIGGALDLASESELPEPLRTYREAEQDAPVTARTAATAVAGLVVLWYLIRGSIHLYGLRARGCRPFATGLVSSVIMMPLVGPVVYGGWSAAFYEASLVLGGVILGWLYLSDVSLQLVDEPSSGSEGHDLPSAMR